ncbi:hypothetical protein BCR34DRAFT_563815 [Clohesyomyces aquaticus]|uniref:CBM1 domain-containing protein n=1 Tax=Clohesyomyces aquaticus TaxID=1231657 RepID=A0A1Y1ZQE2_9PLEO|nr:hypothetical protein BCR34DRAFT_563815 [Clohesyomyces aquaticus]
MYTTHLISLFGLLAILSVTTASPTPLPAEPRDGMSAMECIAGGYCGSANGHSAIVCTPSFSLQSNVLPIQRHSRRATSQLLVIK